MNLYKNILNAYRYIMLILVIILLIFTIFIIYLEVSQLFDMPDIINEEVLEIANESIKPVDSYKENFYKKSINKCIFSIFSDFFVKSNTSYKYYPNCFMEYDYPYKYNNTCLPDQIIEYIISTETLKYDLMAIATECTSIIKYYPILPN
jgi:hypothetical protein